MLLCAKFAIILLGTVKFT